MENIEAMRVWLNANAEECEKYVKNMAKKGEYVDCIKLEAMAEAYRKAAWKAKELKND